MVLVPDRDDPMAAAFSGIITHDTGYVHFGLTLGNSFIRPHCSIQNVQKKQNYLRTLVRYRWHAVCRHGSQRSIDYNWHSIFPHLRYNLASSQSDLCRVRVFHSCISDR
jgi:hypothetical protein